VWLRGVIVPCPDWKNLRTATNLTTRLPTLTTTNYSQSLLNAIALEKSGFKGMRIVVGGKGMTMGMLEKKVTRLPHHNVTGKNPEPFRRMVGLGYPGIKETGYRDFLWMTCASAEEWNNLKGIMVQRLRASAGNPEEFLHAAATQTAFYECGAKFKAVQESK